MREESIEKHYSPEEVSQLLGGKPSGKTIIRMIDSGKIEATDTNSNTNGKRRRYVMSAEAVRKAFPYFKG
ncbi:MAG: hypothetical protein FWE37_02235 [Spirochaetaceae bacterium]|nr:hypothetical protein [Spirochaetaceae bacterium]